MQNSFHTVPSCQYQAVHKNVSESTLSGFHLELLCCLHFCIPSSYQFPTLDHRTGFLFRVVNFLTFLDLSLIKKRGFHAWEKWNLVNFAFDFEHTCFFWKLYTVFHS